VVTIGGFHGKVVEVKDTTVVISRAPNTEVEVEKSALVQSASRVGQA
jgi:preprotein translocase YajC subunit